MKDEYLKFEREFLSPYAKKSENAGAREKPMPPCPMRTEFQRDRDRILHSKSFRRLKHKTQVFLSPEGDHYRTRLTHTLEVSQIARTISRCLKLNEDLTEAIRLGHDLGHTPFGHSGEKTLKSLIGRFHHNEQSLRVVEKLENDGQGLNLTPEVRDGILNHRKGMKPATLEAMVVNYSDRIAYINHDIDDAEHAGLITENMLPKECVGLLGRSKGERINTLIADVVKTSYNQNFIKMSDEVGGVFETLRSYMFKNVYECQSIMKYVQKADKMIRLLYEHYINSPDEIPEVYLKNAEKENFEKNTADKENAVNKTAAADYIAAMTDRYAVSKFESIFIPGSWNGD
ncbi:MAG: deoxyguanosinetriphosphate triphosphohydrolase [Clostridiales bacterium]|jgi:dGTPase|nr:deoxyguanosinetriphosphate triphosphohydrolase [Clostridiales bacterium]